MAMMERPRPVPVQSAPAQPVAAQPAAAASSAQSFTGGYAPAEEAIPAPVPEAAPAVVAAPVVSEAAPAVDVAPAETKTTTKRTTNLTAKERRDANMLAELYSILVTTDHLENAFVRGAVSNEAYEKNCKQLVTQFNTLQSGLKHVDVSTFIKEQGLHCPLAEERLLKTGTAATTLHATGADSKTGAACFNASEKFVTLLDLVTMSVQGEGGSCAVHELMPLVQELQASIAAIPGLPKLDQLEKITQWLVTLNNMHAADSLDERQARQLATDVELAFTALKNWLQSS